MVKINFEDDFATTMVEELLIHGYLEMSCLILKILAKHFKAKHAELTEGQIRSQMNQSFSLIKESFKKLVDEGYLEKLASLEMEKTSEENGKKPTPPKIPKLVSHELNRYELPEIKVDGKVHNF